MSGSYTRKQKRRSSSHPGRRCRSSTKNKRGGKRKTVFHQLDLEKEWLEQSLNPQEVAYENLKELKNRTYLKYFVKCRKSMFRRRKSLNRFQRFTLSEPCYQLTYFNNPSYYLLVDTRNQEELIRRITERLLENEKDLPKGNQELDKRIKKTANNFVVKTTELGQEIVDKTKVEKTPKKDWRRHFWIRQKPTTTNAFPSVQVSAVKYLTKDMIQSIRDKVQKKQVDTELPKPPHPVTSQPETTDTTTTNQMVSASASSPPPIVHRWDDWEDEITEDDLNHVVDVTKEEEKGTSHGGETTPGTRKQRGRKRRHRVRVSRKK